MDSWQAFALGLGVASFIWLGVKIVADHLFIGRQSEALRRMQSEYLWSEDEEMRPFIDDPSTKFPMEG
jgi:hypothetical protein